MTTESGPANPSDERAEMPADRLQAIVQLCRDIVRCLKLDLAIDSQAVSGTTCINLSGPDRPLLLAGSAAVLNSMEYLVNKVFRIGREEYPAIVLDSDNYRQHREAELVLLAQMASEKVLAQQKPLSLQPMTPKERRIVHLALAAIEGVRSQSQGDGECRSITIYPS